MNLRNYSKEDLKKIVLDSIEDRSVTKEEVKCCAYSILDVLYEILSYEEYRELFEEVATALDEEYGVYII